MSNMCNSYVSTSFQESLHKVRYYGRKHYVDAAASQSSETSQNYKRNSKSVGELVGECIGE